MSHYTGVGSRETPQPVLEKMFEIAAEKAKMGLVLRSGGASGADLAFEKGCVSVGGKKEIYLPWEGFNPEGRRYQEAPPAPRFLPIAPEAYRMAKYFHPAWDRLEKYSRDLMARNCYIVLGHDLETPSTHIVCWTKESRTMGGTGQVIRMAKEFGIPIEFVSEGRRQLTLSF